MRKKAAKRSAGLVAVAWCGVAWCGVVNTRTHSGIHHTHIHPKAVSNSLPFSPLSIGKTATVHHVLGRLRRERRDLSFTHVEVNGLTLSTPSQVREGGSE